MNRKRILRRASWWLLGAAYAGLVLQFMALVAHANLLFDGIGVSAAALVAASVLCWSLA